MLLAHYSTLEEVKSQSSLVLGIGVFDGLHLGHLELFETLRGLAQQFQSKAAIWTFDSKIPKPGFSRLMRADDYLQALKNQGVEEVHRMDFIEAVSSMNAEEFLVSVLIEKLNVKAIVLGEDARLGKNRSCSASEFAELAKCHQIEVKLVPLCQLEGEVISSSKIREFIKAGDFKKAEKFLGRPFELSGQVIKDQQLARKLGFPTANIHCDDLTLPPNGVYRCEVVLPDSEKLHPAIAYLGSRPTVSENAPPILEVHLKDWEGDLYQQILRVRNFEKIRSEKKFESLDALKEQLHKDVNNL